MTITNAPQSLTSLPQIQTWQIITSFPVLGGKQIVASEDPLEHSLLSSHLIELSKDYYRAAVV